MPDATKPAKPKEMTKTQLRQVIAEAAGITGKQAEAVLESLTNTAIAQVNTVGGFTIPGLIKITKVIKAATPEKTMISPFTKAQIIVKAKPAHNVVKVRALKGLKDAVS